jgi:hypothetical protein
MRVSEGRTYRSLLLVLLVLMVVAPFFRSSLVTELAFSLVILIALSAATGKRTLFITAVVLVVLTLATKWSGYWMYSPALIGSSHASSLAFEILVAAVMIRTILASRRGTQETIAGAVCVYLFLGILWADAYAILEIVEPGTIAFPESDLSGGDGTRDVRELTGNLIYYSLVTISTLGYGDIVPLTGPARSLAVMEAITGQFYIAILVAWLVSLYATSRRDE